MRAQQLAELQALPSGVGQGRAQGVHYPSMDRQLQQVRLSQAASPPPLDGILDP